MFGERIELCNKALLLFLKSLNEDCYFQLIGFGSSFEYYNKEPLEYNKKNVTHLMDIIRDLSASKGGTELYEPLMDIYNNNIYKKFDMVKHIFLLTDGQIWDKEKTLNLIGSHSDKFNFHSIGIGGCDKDLIKRSALIGNGYSYFIDDLNDMNKVIISALEKSQFEMVVECKSVQTNNIEDKTQKYIHINDIFRHGIILDNSKDKINFRILYNKKEIKISSKNIELIQLPNGEELGKLIIDNYLIENDVLDFRTKIKLSKDYNILCSETAFYAEIQNEIQIKEKLTTITNKDKLAKNNNNINESETDKDISLEQGPESEIRNFGYESTNNYLKINENEIEMNKNKKNKKSFLSCVYSIFSCKKEKNKIINRKILNTENQRIKNIKMNNYKENQDVKSIPEFYILKRDTFDKEKESNYILNIGKSKKKRSLKNKKVNCESNYNYDKSYDKVSENICYNNKKDNYDNCKFEIIKSCCSIENNNEDYDKDDYDKDDYDKDECFKCPPKHEKIKKNKKSPNKNNLEYDRDDNNKKISNFDEIILEQDIIEGNWIRNNKIELIIKEKKDLYEKIKEFSENKGIHDENGIITLFILFYIFKNKAEKVEELKFIIDKAKNFIKKIFNLEYDEIAKELN